ncbi:MAG: PadR family transcriptional regulator [Anaerolineae bacterium]|nr:PadR family transcriptional regulator [Anaerolineae bacterium]
MTKPLPNTAYAVLGFLAAGEPMSGYEVRKSAENLHYFYWSPAQSQIYSELRRLAAHGYVTSELVRQDGKPDKRLYQITEAGTTAFRVWLNETPAEPTMMKHAMLLRLFFGQSAEPARLGVLLEQFISDGEEALAQIAIVREYAELDPDARWQGIVAAWSEAHFTTEIAFARELLRRLADGEL